MNKIILGLVAVVVLAAGAFVLAKNSNKEETQQTPTTSTAVSDSSDASNQTGEAKSEDTNSVSIINFAYSPSDITVKKGTTVTWTNNDSTAHNVVSDQDGGPAGPLLSQGQTYSFTFDTVGTFNYICEPHPQMTGTVTVTE